MTDIPCNQANMLSAAKAVGAEPPSRYPEWMRVTVLYFGVLRDQFGAADQIIDIPGNQTVGDLLRILRQQTSNDAMADTSERDEQLWRSLAVAVNREYGSASIVLRDGDEVALLPPVSGGYCAYGDRLALLANRGVSDGGEFAC
jgi:molybdopterin converting factor subunit 1